MIYNGSSTAHVYLLVRANYADASPMIFYSYEVVLSLLLIQILGEYLETIRMVQNGPCVLRAASQYSTRSFLEGT